MGFLPHMFDKGCENLGNSAAHEKSNSASVLCNAHHVLINTTMSKTIKPPVRITLKPPARRFFFLRLKRNTILLRSRKRVCESGSDRGAKQRKRKSGQIQRSCKNRPAGAVRSLRFAIRVLQHANGSGGRYGLQRFSYKTA